MQDNKKITKRRVLRFLKLLWKKYSCGIVLLSFLGFMSALSLIWGHNGFIASVYILISILAFFASLLGTGILIYISCEFYSSLKDMWEKSKNV